MSKIIIPFFLLLFFSLQIQCSSPKESSPQAISASIWPIASLLKDIVGDKIPVHCILPEGSSPHTFEPTFEQIAKMRNIRLHFKIGKGLDDWIDKLVNQSKNKPEVITLAEGFPLIKTTFGCDHDHDHHHHDHGIEDPHIWLDPEIVLTKIIPTISIALEKRFPKWKEYFQENREKLEKEIEEADKKVAELLRPLKKRKIVTIHSAFIYFARRYNLEMVAVLEPWPDKELTARYLQRIIKIMKTHSCNVIFEELQSKRGPKFLERDEGFKLSSPPLDPMGGPQNSAKSKYSHLLLYNAQIFRKFLE